MPTRSGMTDIAIDPEVPPDVIDDNVLVSVLPAIHWRDGLSFELSVFASGRIRS